ncbi:MAG TPA: hypothetical protein VGO16_05400 [Pseudonocardiaceae bacterium]|jgi:hypothetical protein|nr:hypothetical protein [Pseudonocardiaceae bacterium]
MHRLTGALAFFDIGNTLASVTISSSGDRVEKLTVYPYVPGVLGELRDRGARLGVISNRGPLPAEDVNQALEAAGLWNFFEPELVIYGPKDSPRIFEQAAAHAGVPDHLLFVGEDPGERAQALLAGFLVAPHPQLALPVLEQHAPLRYVRITMSASRFPGSMPARTGGPSSGTCRCCPCTSRARPARRSTRSRGGGAA